MQNVWSVVDLLCQNPHWWSPVISSAYGVNLNSRMLDKVLYVIDKLICLYVYYNLFYHPRYNEWLLTLLRQSLLPNRIKKFMVLRANGPTPRFNQFCWNLINSRWFVSFLTIQNHFNLKSTGLRHWWLCCMYFCLPAIFNPMYIQ